MIEIGWAGVGVIAAILANAFFTVWSAASFKATISAKIDNLVASLNRLDTEMEKRDSKIAAAFNKIDNLQDRVTRIEIESENK